MAGTSAVANERQGLILVVRFGLLAAMLLLGHGTPGHAARLAFRRVTSPPRWSRERPGDRTPDLVVGTELVIAFGALSAAS